MRSHLVAAQILVVQPFQPLAQLFAGDAIGDVGSELGIFENLIFDENGAIYA
jgi:hypothetical protein